VHLDEDQHQTLGLALADVIAAILQDGDVDQRNASV
jgi:hypothetical protein